MHSFHRSGKSYEPGQTFDIGTKKVHSLPAIQLEAAIVNRNETRGIVSPHEIRSCTQPELKEDDQIKGQRHLGRDNGHYLAQTAEGGFQLICIDGLPVGPRFMPLRQIPGSGASDEKAGVVYPLVEAGKQNNPFCRVAYTSLCCQHFD
jgi:hypothetical protein